MAGRIRAQDWATTPLGPQDGWSDRLRLTVEMMLAQGFPTNLCVGPQRTLLYNDAYAQLIGGKHPDALGRDVRATFAEVEARFAPALDQAFRGETMAIKDAFYPFRRATEIEDAWFDISYSPVRDDAGSVIAAFVVLAETTERVLAEQRRGEAEAVLRASAMRQAFLLTLSDALRTLASAAEIQGEASRLLGERLDADWVVYGEIDQARDTVDIERGYSRKGEPPITGKQPLSAFGWTLPLYRAGLTIVENDTQTSDRVPDAERAALSAIRMTALISVPLLKAGEWVGALAVSTGEPRIWTELEVRLVEDTAERIWAAIERARAESRLRQSEAQLRQFAEASSDALWIRDAATLRMEYVSPAFDSIYGFPGEALLNDDPQRWASLIVPDDRAGALACIEAVKGGRAVVHEFRILRASDGAFRWIRNTDFPLLDEQGRIERIGGIAHDITEAKQSVEHQAILLAELQHRVRNLLAMIRSVAARTGDTAGSVDEYRDLIEGRLRALARTQALLTRTANAGVDLDTLVREEVTVQAEHGGQYVISGPVLLLAPKAAEVLTLAVHELATNALKYGALVEPNGHVTVAWRVVYEDGEPWLRFDWRENTGSGVLPPKREGFGTQLITRRVPYELKGRGSLDFNAEGVQCRLEFPLVRGDSILETDAVTLQTTISGGELDMSGEVNLAGARVLVVEDDYYLALDTQRALQQAGGVVLGPCPDEKTVLQVIAHDSPGCAVVDINLGEGPSFTVASALQTKGIPFVFVTGYDDVVIPEAFSAVPRLRKPVELRQIVRAAAQAALGTTS